MLNIAGPAPVAETSASLQDWWIEAFALLIAEPAKMKLYVNDLVPSPGTILADLTEAGFGGYAEQPISESDFSGPFVMPDGSAQKIASVAPIFTCTDSVTPQTCYGFYLVDAAETRLLASCRFLTPFLMDANGKFIQIEYSMLMPAASPQVIADATSNG